MKEKITVTFSSLEEAVAAHTAVLFMRDGLEEIRHEILGDCDVSQRRSVHGGIEAITYTDPSIFPVDDVFPLRPILWEGRTTYAPRHAESYLRSIYGDYMSFPKFKVGGHENIMKHKGYDYDWEIRFLTKVKVYMEYKTICTDIQENMEDDHANCWDHSSQI